MRKVLDASNVAHLWAHQTQEEATTPCRNFAFHGPELRSYHTSIGYHFGAFVLLSSDNFSHTTSKQLGHAWHATNHLKQIPSGIFKYGRCFDYNPPSVKEIIEDRDQALTRALQDLQKTRKPNTRAWAANSVHKVIDDINYLIKAFKLKRRPVSMPEDISELVETSKGILAGLEAKKAAAEKRAAAKARKENAEKLAAWFDGQAVYLPSALYRIEGSCLLTVRENEVVTSLGARVPLSHVVKAIKFYNSRRTKSGAFNPWKTNGHKIHVGVFTLDSIDEAGIVEAGCHTFTEKEISRFCVRWSI